MVAGRVVICGNDCSRFMYFNLSLLRYLEASIVFFTCMKTHSFLYLLIAFIM